MLGLSLTKEKKTVIRYSVRQPFFGCPANYVPHFPDTRVCRPRKYGASADRENTAKTAMPKTFFGCLRQQIFQQPVMTEWVWGNARREKRRDLFLKDFLSEQSVGNRFLLFCLFIRQKTAKRDKKTVYFTKNSQNTGSEKNAYNNIIRSQNQKRERNPCELFVKFIFCQKNSKTS